MNEEKTPTTASAPSAPQVERITPPPGKRLPEPYYRVKDELTFPQFQGKGIEPLKRVRGISKTDAERAGIPLPKEQE